MGGFICFRSYSKQVTGTYLLLRSRESTYLSGHCLVKEYLTLERLSKSLFWCSILRYFRRVVCVCVSFKGRVEFEEVSQGQRSIVLSNFKVGFHKRSRINEGEVRNRAFVVNLMLVSHGHSKYLDFSTFSKDILARLCTVQTICYAWRTVLTVAQCCIHYFWIAWFQDFNVLSKLYSSEWFPVRLHFVRILNSAI
jgi:hypothetical protein